MSQTGNKETILRYLLDELSEGEKEEVERNYFAQDDLFEQIQAAEAELIDTYVAGELSRDLRDRFEKRFLSTPQGRERVNFAEALKRLARETKAPKKKPHFRLALAAAISTVVLGGSWILIHSLNLRSELAQVRSERGVLQQQQTKLQSETARQRERIEELNKKLEDHPEPRVTFFVLTAGLVRDADQIRPLQITADTLLVKLQLTLEADEYVSYRAVLQTVEEKEVWRQNLLRITKVATGKAILLDLPSTLLESGDYILMLQGVSPKGGFEDIGEYYFRVRK